MMWKTGGNSQQSQGFRAGLCYISSEPTRCYQHRASSDQVDRTRIKMARDDITRQGRTPATGTNEEYGPSTMVHISVAIRMVIEKATQMKAMREAAYSRKVLDKKGFAP
jgi:hypothetical protein